MSKEYKVIGIFRRSSSTNFWRINDLGIQNDLNLTLLECDLLDLGSIIRVVEANRPDEIYNLAAQSFVGVSFDQPINTAQVTALGVVNILEAIRIVDKDIRFYQASTSELFGKAQDIPQDENTSFYPRSPYGIAKLYAHWMTINYRESYDIFGACGILFNHESPLRGLEFVTRKISNSVAKISQGEQEVLELGNLDAKRDWGFAKDYVEGMWAMLQIDTPDTFVLATGRTETVRNFVDLCFKSVGIDIEWKGTAEKEMGINASNGDVLVKVNPIFYRPAEVELLVGDSTKAFEKLNWEPKMELEELSSIMVQADLLRVKKGQYF